MDFILNFGLAWVSVLVAVILAVVFMTRKMIKNASSTRGFWINLNRTLRKYHKELGIILILTGFIHGYYSSMSVFSLNLGTITWILSILLGLNWLFRTQLSTVKNWLSIHRFLAIAFVIVMVLHINEAGIQILEGIGTDTTETVTVLEPEIIEGYLDYGDFTDGTYTGIATGYGSNLTLEVVIENNKIVSIEIISHNEKNSKYYQKAFSTVPAEIISAQSLDVDSVSGATFSSVGIINAVNNALSKALIAGTLPELSSLPTKRGH